MARAKKAKRGSGAVRKDEPPAPPEPTEEAAPAAAPSATYVAPGKSVTSKRGILGPGKLVTAGDFGGEDNLHALLNAGAVVKR